MSEQGAPVTVMRDLWNSLSDKNKYAFISHLQPGQQWDLKELHLTGIRFVDRMMERFADYGIAEPSRSSVLEIGCGVGRMLKPLSCRFKEAYGVDISEKMLQASAEYCACLPNVSVMLVDGSTLTGIDSQSIDYVTSCGVFQHITDIEVILGYIREGLRVLRPDGVMLFQFEGNRTERVGTGQRGAKITASELDRGLTGLTFRIREVSVDPEDKTRTIVAVIQKSPCTSPTTDGSFLTFPMTNRRWLSGVYDDIQTKTHMHKRQAGEMMPLTFYE